MALVRSAIFAVGVLAFAAVGAHAKELARVTAFAACPSGVDGCIELLMHWDFARTDKPPIAGKRTDRVRVLLVRGRLSAKRAEAYELAISAPDADQKNHLGEVAYLGRSRDGLPVIATNRGPLAIETRGLNVGRGAAVVVIDTKAGSIAQAFLGGLDGGAYIFNGAGQVAALSKSGACVSPPSSRPGLLKPILDCELRHELPVGLAFGERILGAVTLAPDADLALVRRLLPQTSDLDDTQLRTRIGRIDERHLVVTPWAD